MKYVAFVTKGLEDISEEELLSLGNIEIVSKKQKFIEFEYDGSLDELKKLKTVDDIGIYISEISVEKLLNLEIDIEKIKEISKFLEKEKEMNTNFSITISKYKNNDVSEESLKELLSPFLTKELQLAYTPLDHSNLDIRVNITEDICLITVKAFSQSLFRRDYDHETQLGSIRSTIAAAMLYRLLNGKKDLKVLDNFCGSGTFLCEALIMGEEVFGNDIDENAVKLTLENLKKIKKQEYQITNYDAIKTNWTGDFFDIAVSNLPWNKQIKVNQMYKLIEGSIKEYARILKPESKVGLITTKPEVVIKCLKKYFEIKDIEMFKIGHLGQVPTLVLAKVRKNPKS